MDGGRLSFLNPPRPLGEINSRFPTGRSWACAWFEKNGGETWGVSGKQLQMRRDRPVAATRRPVLVRCWQACPGGRGRPGEDGQTELETLGPAFALRGHLMSQREWRVAGTGWTREHCTPPKNYSPSSGMESVQAPSRCTSLHVRTRQVRWPFCRRGSRGLGRPKVPRQVSGRRC